MTNDVDKLRKKIRSINTDGELEEIHEILDRFDGKFLSEHKMITGDIEKIVKKGHIQDIRMTNEMDGIQSVGRNISMVPTGVVRAEITVVAHRDDIYDD